MLERVKWFFIASYSVLLSTVAYSIGRWTARAPHTIDEEQAHTQPRLSSPNQPSLPPSQNLESELHKAQDSNVQLEGLIIRLNKELDLAKENLAQQTQSNRQLSAGVAQLEEELRKAKASIRDLQDLISRLKTELETARSVTVAETKAVESEKKEKEKEKEGESQKRREEVERLNERVAQLQQENTAFRKEIESAVARCDELEKRWEVLSIEKEKIHSVASVTQEELTIIKNQLQQQQEREKREREKREEKEKRDTEEKEKRERDNQERKEHKHEQEESDLKRLREQEEQLRLREQQLEQREKELFHQQLHLQENEQRLQREREREQEQELLKREREQEERKRQEDDVQKKQQSQDQKRKELLEKIQEEHISIQLVECLSRPEDFPEVGALEEEIEKVSGEEEQQKGSLALLESSRADYERRLKELHNKLSQPIQLPEPIRKLREEVAQLQDQLSSASSDLDSFSSSEALEKEISTQLQALQAQLLDASNARAKAEEDLVELQKEVEGQQTDGSVGKVEALVEVKIGGTEEVLARDSLAVREEHGWAASSSCPFELVPATYVSSVEPYPDLERVFSSEEVSVGVLSAERSREPVLLLASTLTSAASPRTKLLVQHALESETRAWNLCHSNFVINLYGFSPDHDGSGGLALVLENPFEGHFPSLSARFPRDNEQLCWSMARDVLLGCWYLTQVKGEALGRAQERVAGLLRASEASSRAEEEDWNTITPSRLWVTPEWRAKISPFPLTPPPTDTYRYFSLEKLEAQPDIDQEKSDMYSFGVLVWEVLTGKTAWEGLSRDQLKDNLRGGQTLPFDDKTLSLPEDLANLLEQSLQPAKRRPAFKRLYQNMTKKNRRLVEDRIAQEKLAAEKIDDCKRDVDIQLQMIEKAQRQLELSQKKLTAQQSITADQLSALASATSALEEAKAQVTAIQSRSDAISAEIKELKKSVEEDQKIHEKKLKSDKKDRKKIEASLKKETSDIESKLDDEKKHYQRLRKQLELL